MVFVFLWVNRCLFRPNIADSDLATQELFELELRLIKFAEAASHQERIENNHRRNEAIGARINLGIKGAILAPLIYLTVLGLTRLTLAA
jgi:hypothetical protein